MNDAISTDREILKVLQQIHQELKNRQDHDFNWVHAREECTTWCHFQKMRSEVEQYVQHRNKYIESKEFKDNPLHPQNFTLVLSSQKDTFFTVGRKNYSGEKWVRFSFETRKIIISSPGKDPISTMVTLDDDGECWLCIDGVVGTFRRWQVIRKALEWIFF